jgi:hypothetical protein
LLESLMVLMKLLKAISGLCHYWTEMRFYRQLVISDGKQCIYTCIYVALDVFSNG